MKRREFIAFLMGAATTQVAVAEETTKDRSDDRMRRREFIAAVGCAATWSRTVCAQERPTKLRRIGAIFAGNPSDARARVNVTGLRDALQALGWEEGRNIQVEYRWGGGDPDRIDQFAKELVGLQPELIVAVTTLVARTLQRETRTIPLVLLNVTDPVGSGFAVNLARPGGNSTGFVDLEGSLGGKWIELIKELARPVSRVGMLFNPGTAAALDYYLPSAQTAAGRLGIELVMGPVRSTGEIESFVDHVARSQDSAIAVMPDSFPGSYRDTIVSLVNQRRVPTIYPWRYMTMVGGLLSYGVDPVDAFRRAPTYIDRILKGEKPEDLPFQLPTKFELVINVKTAKTLGLTIPPSLLARADEVIE